MRLFVSLLLLVAAVIGTSNAFAPNASPQGALSLSQTGRVFQYPSWSSTRSIGNNQNDQSLWQQPQSQSQQQHQSFSFTSTSLFSDAWDEDVDYDKEWPSGSGGDQMNLPDEQDLLQQLSSSNAASTDMDELRMKDRDILNEVKEELGVDLNLRLGDDQLDEIKEKAREIIEKKVQENVNQVNRMRERMNREIERNRNMMQTQSELKGKKESARLLSKIDRMTEEFLQSTSAARESTQRAAAADKSMEGKGVELGAWGTIDGDNDSTVVVPMSDLNDNSFLVGSVDNAKVQQARRAKMDATSDSAAGEPSSRVLIVADESKDPIAKKLLKPLITELETTFVGLVVETIKPSATMPLGGNEAACLVLFLPSLSQDPKSPMLDRLLRRTLLPGGAVAQPPTQIVAVSTLGTERTDKFPYSMQNLVGRPLDNRRRFEESIVALVQQRMEDPYLDYTLCKLGEIVENGKCKDDLTLMPGDVLDGTTSVDAASKVLVQAIALQPSARNSTLSVIGNMPTDELSVADWDDLFVKLRGPELYRTTMLPESKMETFDLLAEYIVEWGSLMAKNQKLITPIKAVPSFYPKISPSLQEQRGVKLIFQSTKTGKNYMSKDEERDMEAKTGRSPAKSSVSPSRKQRPEGGVEVLVEVTQTNELRVRARRCNMADSTIVKELSEESILSRLQESLKAFDKNYLS